MAMRNWWINGEVDGRRTALTGGPVSKDGEFTLEIRQRDKGESVLGITVNGYVDCEGRLVLTVKDENGMVRWTKATLR